MRMTARIGRIGRPAFFMLLFFPLGAFATEWLPEFESLTEAEQEAFEGPARLTSEYESDVLAYTKPLSWEAGWLSSRNVFDTSVGSTGAKHFLIDARGKFRAELSRHLEFRLTHFQDRNREKDSEHTIVEAVIRPVTWAGLSLYAEPSLYKREDDTGFAVVVNPSDKHEIRVFNTYVDVTRLRRNDRNDTYVVGHEPTSMGIVGRLWAEAAPIDERTPGVDFIEYAVRHESPTRWLFPDENYEYRYWKFFGALYGSRALSDRMRVNARLTMDRKFESKTPGEGMSEVGRHEAWTTDRLFLQVETELSRIGPGERWLLRPGAKLALRHWKTTEGSVRFRDVLPYAWLSIPAFGAGEREDYFEVGYEFTWHDQADGGYPPVSVDGIERGLEHRLNLVYEMGFGRTSKIRILASGDIDRMFTREAWEGGSIQIQTAF